MMPATKLATAEVEPSENRTPRNTLTPSEGWRLLKWQIRKDDHYGQGVQQEANDLIGRLHPLRIKSGNSDASAFHFSRDNAEEPQHEMHHHHDHEDVKQVRQVC